MDLNEVLKGLELKIKGAGKISRLSSKHFGFKNWHAATLALLRVLPPLYFQEVNNFKKFTFETTGYKRGKKFASQTDTTKYTVDLDSAVKVLKEIIKKKVETVSKKKPDLLVDKKIKPDKPISKKPGTKKTFTEKDTKKSSSGRKPAKKGSSSTRKKK